MYAARSRTTNAATPAVTNGNSGTDPEELVDAVEANDVVDELLVVEVVVEVVEPAPDAASTIIVPIM